MLEVKNKTPFEVAIAPAMDVQLNEFIVVVVKATYTIDNNSTQLLPADQQLPVYLTDEYYGQPDITSIKNPSDAAMLKYGTDIIFNGQAYNPAGAQHIDTLVKVGGIQKCVRVLGNRHWEKVMGKWRISTPEAFDTMPMAYENVYGGYAVTDDDYPQFFESNPVGKGFSMKKDKRDLQGLALPNLEDPNDLIDKLHEPKHPSCLAAVAPHWAPRRKFAGTYDENWNSDRKPFLPLDFNERYFNAAATGLTSEQPLTGGEPVECHNLSRHQWLAFTLPTPRIHLRYSMRQKRQELPPPQLDTIIIEPEEDALAMVWRSRIPCNQELLYCDWISVRASL